MLVRALDGFQIGIEAKLKLNAKVVVQAAEFMGTAYTTGSGPDCRAVLIPARSNSDLEPLCELLGLVVIRMREPQTHPLSETWKQSGDPFRPDLPGKDWRFEDEARGNSWPEFMPAARLELPKWVPDTKSGDKCPITLTQWKIRAIQIAVLLEKTGYVTRQDFKNLKINMTRWVQGSLESVWLRKQGDYGKWVKGAGFPDFRKQHPKNFEQIAAEIEDWNPRKFSDLLAGHE